MSGRGGRGGGGAQRAPPPSHRGGGRGGRGGGGRGRGGGRNAPSPAPQAAYAPPPPSSVASSSAAAPPPLSMESLSLKDPPLPTPANLPPSSSKAIVSPLRPSYGTAGNKCVVRANHFLVKLSKDVVLCHYDVSVSPEVTSRGVNRAVMDQLIDLYRGSLLGNKSPAYDGRKNLYTAGPLPFESKEFVIRLVNRDEQTNSVRREREFKVAIKFAGRTDLQQLQQFLEARQRDAPQETLQILDVVLRESPTKNYVPVGRSFFSPTLGPTASFGDGLECWKGFYQSIRPTQMGLSLNIDISCTSFYEPIEVIEFVYKFIRVQGPTRPLTDTDRVKVKKALRGVKVIATHGNFPRQYRISGITQQPTNQLKFPVDDQGNTMTVVQYFQEKYNVNLQYSQWPSLQVGSDSKLTYLPMEVCKIVKGQRYSKKLNDQQVTAILRAACQRPADRERNVVEMVRRNNYNKDRLATEFGIQVQENLALVEARVLPPPELKYHASGREATCRPRVGQWNMINKRMVNGGTVDYWTCINFSRMHQDGVNMFCKELIKMCKDIGMCFCDNPIAQIYSARPDRLEAALVDVHTRATSAISKRADPRKQLQLLIVILPDARGSYGTIKRLCETELGIVTQCCQPRNASRANNKQYLENVSLKINVKVGGRNTVLSDAVSKNIPLLTDVPTIVFGADVTHPPPGEDSSPSIAAVVASMDWPEATKYRCLISSQLHRQELIKDLFQVVQDPQRGPLNRGMIRDHLIAFKAATGFKPYRIIFYRDGVSEGQFKEVLLYELDAIRKACASLEEGYLPPVTFVVVQKRHHTRLFPADHRNRDMTDRSGNILPGTVVDRIICHPTEFDFYLCSHAGIQGTSRPTHYHVLWDENKFSADALQILTNNLCYTYARCTRSVSVVPPAYYAHLAAFRARYYIDDISDSGTSAVRGGNRNTRELASALRQLPLVKDNVKDVMFYC
ncbi:hypothetical protein AAC387_Pa01g4288 [Persea americana]